MSLNNRISKGKENLGQHVGWLLIELMLEIPKITILK